MKKLFSFLVIPLLAILVYAFYPTENAGNNGTDTPAYEIAKQKYHDAYLQYKSNLSRGIISAPPVDPSGMFRVDENGNMNVANGQIVQSSTFQPNPNPLPDVVNNYAFTQSTTTYTAINGTGTLVVGSTNCDDGTFGTFPIGFTFTYNGAPQTVFGVCCNGFLGFGAIPGGTYTPLSGNVNMIAPFAYDLQGAATGSIYYQTTGVAPNRVCTVEWYQWGFWPTSGNELSFEIKLFETTNAVQLVYQTGTRVSTNSLQVGINGNPNTDFNNRTTTTNWAATTAGGSNGATCSFSPTIFPASGLTFQFAPPAPPLTPVQVRPVYGSIGRPQVDTIQWNPSAGATAYNMQLATDTTFATLLFNDTTLVGTSYTVGTFSPLTTYWWRVRAKNAVGWSAFSPGWKFKIMGPASTPTLLNPPNNATNQPVALTTNWSKSIDLTSKPHGLHIIQNNEGSDNSMAVSNYWYELYSDTTAAVVIRDSTLIDTTRAISGLLNNQNYWWRVKAKNNVGWGAFSAYFKFTTVIAAPAPPTNIFPANNSTGIIPTTKIDWSFVPTAATYKLQVSTDSTFATTQLDSTTSVDSLFVPAGRLLNNTKYYWHVRAQNVGGNSAYGPTWNFTTSLVGITINGGEIPKAFNLYQAYPNPFNPSATIKFDIPKSAEVSIKVYNTIGQEVATLINGHVEAGSYSVTWDAANFSSGVYFYRINSGDYTNIRKMVLIK